MCMHVCVYVHACTCMRVRACACTCVRVRACACVRCTVRPWVKRTIAPVRSGKTTRMATKIHTIVNARRPGPSGEMSPYLG